MFFSKTSYHRYDVYLKGPVNLLCVQNLTFVLIQLISVISISIISILIYLLIIEKFLEILKIFYTYQV